MTGLQALLAFALLCVMVNCQEDCPEDVSDAMCKSNRDAEVCSGRGDCVCGMCACNPFTPENPTMRYSGQFCDCDDYSCDYFNGQICGGHGQCDCGVCRCLPEYEGSACECTLSTETCIATNGLICNGKGSCRCGRCDCAAVDSYYRGPTCEECPTCPGQCEKLRDCVLCFVYQEGPLTQEECDDKCSRYNIGIVDQLDDKDEQRHCKFRSGDGCVLDYTYERDDIMTVRVPRTRECQQPVPTFADNSGASVLIPHRIISVTLALISLAFVVKI